MKHILLFRLFNVISLLLIVQSVYAQNGDGTLPPSFESVNIAKSFTVPFVTPIHFDVDQLKKEDAITNKAGMPFRISYHIPVDLDLMQTSSIIRLNNNLRVLQKTILSPNANGLVLIFDRMYIPQGARLYIYTADKTQVVGAYTSQTNPSGGLFSTPILFQEEVVLEYVPSAISTESPDIHITDVSYVYSVKRTEDAQGIYYCMVNVNCGEGDNWQQQKKGVVRLTTTFSDGLYYCSGSLINNVRQDGTPYILSADHCIVDHYKTPKDTTKFELMKVDFLYEQAGCSPIENRPTPAKTLVGVDFMLSSSMQGGSDGSLLRLKQAIPNTWDVYYNGWDASGASSYNGVNIHHPYGYVKSISTYNTQLTESSSGADMDGVICAPYAHWRVRWAQTASGYSVTAGGSSGSPIFSLNGLIVGTLTGGSSQCSNPTLLDYFGKMAHHLDKDLNSANWMKIYLDPDNTGLMLLNGYSPTSSISETSDDDIYLRAFFSDKASTLNINSHHIIRQVMVYDLLGRPILIQDDFSASAVIIPSENWSKGIYTISVKTDKGLISTKILK